MKRFGADTKIRAQKVDRSGEGAKKIAASVLPGIEPATYRLYHRATPAPPRSDYVDHNHCSSSSHFAKTNRFTLTHKGGLRAEFSDASDETVAPDCGTPFGPGQISLGLARPVGRTHHYRVGGVMATDSFRA